MGAGISTKSWNAMQYRALKTQQRKLSSRGIHLEYKDLELRGPHCRIYFAGLGPASNGERFCYLVLRYNPTNEPDAAKKEPGDIDYTNFHTRKDPAHTYEAGIQILQSLNPRRS